MLEPREADIPALFLILVVLPLVTYILLGKWSEASKKKARINMLAQLAAEEARNVEVMAAVDVVPVAGGPSFNVISHVCARCFSPATTRCSRCKSVRYCSGKCQIIHWRQGHKQECQEWENERSNFSAAMSSVVGASQCASSVDVNLKSTTSFENGRLLEVKTNDDVDSCLEEAISNSITSSPYLKTRSTEPPPAEAHRKHKCSGKAPINDYQKDAEYHSEQVKTLCQEVYCSEEALELTSAVEKSSAKGGMNFRKPPYTVDSNFSLRKSALKQTREQPISGNEKKSCIEKESRVHQLTTSITPSGHDINRIPNMENNKALSSRVTSKLPKNSTDVKTSETFGKNKMLFPYEDLVKLFQCEVCEVSPRGLSNCGNSCYANAVLQCLACTKPLLVYLLRGIHSKYCCVKDWCLFCELEMHASKLRESGGPLSPSRILSNMRNIGCRMGGGNQEDAHEFLRLLVMSMQAICLEGLGGEKEVDPRLQETTLIQQIFGGRIKSKVKCLRCQHESERYENIMDLTLEIHGWVESLEDALTQFTAPEELDGDNMYRCGRCSAYVKARKQLSVHEAPNILTIVLKRFQTGKYGKINKCVSFPDLLDMIPFMTGTGDSPPLYMLYGVIVHLDAFNASFSGHYVAYVKDLQGDWFRVDDTEVQPVTLSQVMSEGAYMLFYSRSFPRPPRIHSHSVKQNPNQAKHSASKISRPPRYDSAKLAGVLSLSQGSPNASRSAVPKKGSLCGSGSMDFYEASSSDWSLFTSSDDSSFTTESTSDSFSTVDYTDAANLDPISSLFSPVCMPEYSHKSTISCRSFSCCRPQTRFFTEESKGFARDSWTPTQADSCVHKVKNPMLLCPGNICYAPANRRSNLEGGCCGALPDGM